ncbi:MAG: nitrous oxide-stimulated promoter family protein [Anaerovibrio sp.]|uniref:nitrous oxide-stimulated promoter family protein n=1 Tax=Anaerovibrio sp. TaxID=1872532 RepID=UPI0025E1FB62|nr:nitrous oxide-stimulated promoter family protein [Anaerovibrio sp.]MCR5177034.1 nitrous oxide-stimulated promoter family protein [Anaerovibrio sp.]
MDKIQYKKEQELETIAEMINIYCRDIHKTDGTNLCPECQDMLDYVKKRIALCPRGGEAVSCGNCKTHCYAPKRRQKMRAIMNYSASKMLLDSPIMAIRNKIAQWFLL